MTKNELQQYRYLIKEIQDLERRIKVGPAVAVADVVKGSADSYPYTQHSIGICGVVIDDKLIKQYSKQRDKLVNKCLAIESWMEDIDDSLVRQIIRHRYVQGLSWRQVAQRVGGNNTEASVKMTIKRYLENK